MQKLTSSKFRKGDLVIVSVEGRPTQFEILSSYSRGRGLKSVDEIVYDVKEVNSGETRTISQDEILRLATPVDNSSSLFVRKKN